jgi:threo-3-hydroxy-L-aspartate ammonia-lyase
MFNTLNDLTANEKELILKADLVKKASERLGNQIHRTPVFTSTQLNRFLGHDIHFKMECFQKTGSFKARGAMNTILTLKETKMLPKEVVTFSSGNHSQALAFAACKLGIKTNVLMSKNASEIKIQSAKNYGANVILCDTRKEAYRVHPYDHEAVIAGQGTAIYEALEDIARKPHAIFVPVGGGGLISGTYLAKKLISPSSKVYGAEPENANDAERSLQQGVIYAFEDSPQTIADGVQALKLSPRTFAHLKQCEGLITSSEEEIIYWTQWLTHLLKATIEPCSALAMASAVKWLKGEKGKKTVLILISGGNLSVEKQRTIWQTDYLAQVPSL